jgi:hypothetical protein
MNFVGKSLRKRASNDRPRQRRLPGFLAMRAMNFGLSVDSFALRRNDREQIHPVAVGAGQIEQNVLLYLSQRVQCYPPFDV